MNINDFRQFVVIPVLNYLEPQIPFNTNDVYLMLLTAVAESNLYNLTQLSGGPARGVFQMEPKTESDIWQTMFSKPKYFALRDKIKDLQVSKLPREVNAAANLFYGAAMARCKYYRDPEPIPDYMDALAMAKYYKRIYNTEQGMSKISTIMQLYRLRILN